MSDQFVLCKAPSELVHENTVIIGQIAEGIIQGDWQRHLGRSSVFPASKKDFADFTSGFANTTLYRAFLVGNNPQLSVSELLLLSAELSRVPDFCTHDVPRRADYYEVKPNSVSGRRAGVKKIAEIDAFNANFSLPYRPGTIYNPDKNVEYFNGTIGGQPHKAVMHFKRTQPALIVYEFCFTSTPVAGLEEGLALAILSGTTVAFLALKGRLGGLKSLPTTDNSSFIENGGSLKADPLSIQTKVGRDGVNQRFDGKLVQFMLNDSIFHDRAGNLLKLDGIVGPKTISAIEQYQTRKSLKVDGRITPNGQTFSSLKTSLLGAIGRGFKLPI
jgi:hypothetical protein